MDTKFYNNCNNLRDEQCDHCNPLRRLSLCSISLLLTVLPLVCLCRVLEVMLKLYTSSNSQALERGSSDYIKGQIKTVCAASPLSLLPK